MQCASQGTAELEPKLSHCKSRRILQVMGLVRERPASATARIHECELGLRAEGLQASAARLEVLHCVAMHPAVLMIMAALT